MPEPPEPVDPGVGVGVPVAGGLAHAVPLASIGVVLGSSYSHLRKLNAYEIGWIVNRRDTITFDTLVHLLQRYLAIGDDNAG